MRKFLSYLEGWRGIVLILYMWVIMMGFALAYLDRSFMKATYFYKYCISIAEFLLIVLVYICPKLLRKAENFTILSNLEPFTKVTRRKFFVRSWLIAFGAFMIMYISFWPGCFSTDCLNQYIQVIRAKYNDWHPVIHTLFAFTLPLKISGGWTGSVVLFQIIVFSLALAYSSYTLAEFGNTKYASLSLLYIVLNSATLSIAVIPWKDVTFAIFAMLSMAFAVNVYFSDGAWLDSIAHVAMFTVVISLATIFRHNAILFTLPLLIAVVSYVKCWRKIFLVVGVCAVIFAIRGGLYSYINVEKPGYRIVETTCTPMTIIGNAVYETPEKLDEDILEFAYKVAPKEVWQENYSIGSFNSVKFGKINGNVIEQAGYAKILGMMFRCFVQTPRASLRGFFALTDMVYGIAGPVDWVIGPDVSGTREREYGIIYKGIPILQLLFHVYRHFTVALLKHIFWHTGILLLIMLVFMLAKLHFDKLSNLKRLLLVLPIFTYDFGTMLFLGGNDFRFFYCTYLVFPLVILVMLRDKNEAQ